MAALAADSNQPMVTKRSVLFGVNHRGDQSMKKSWLDRMLSLFTDVRAGEGATAFMMLVNVFLLLVCYSVIKTAREPLILLGGGAEVRSYAAAGQALAVDGIRPAVQLVCTAGQPRKLLVGVYLFFLVNIELFAVGRGGGGSLYRGRVLHLGRHLQLVARRAVLGLRQRHLHERRRRSPLSDDRRGADRRCAVRRLHRRPSVPGARVPAQAVLQISAGLLVVAVVVFLLVNGRVHVAFAATAQPLSGGSGFALVWQNPYLRAIAVMMILLNAVNTTGRVLRLAPGDRSRPGDGGRRTQTSTRRPTSGPFTATISSG